MDKEIFSLIGDEKEKVKLFQDLANARGEILCKGDDDELVHLRVNTYNDKAHFAECINESAKAVLKDNEEFLGHFFIGAEKYFFEGRIKQLHGRYSVALPTELYHLQRRQNYRVRIPESFKASLSIHSVNGQSQNIVGHLADLSSQGCKVTYKMPSPHLKVGDKVSGQLGVGAKTPLQVHGVIRHVSVEDTVRAQQTFGIEFTPRSLGLENQLFAQTMELHRQIFKRPDSI